jgi:AcrR family transcriptional regulator
MAGEIKPRRYESPRRREQAAATRQAILDAAQTLFERDGYAATTMAAIAAEAGVALKTVYVALDTKSGVLRALWNLLLRGDDADVSVAGSDWYRGVLEEPDPARRLRLNARHSRVVKARAGGVLRVVRTAAAVDADIAALWERIESEFHANQREIVRRLAADGALRPGLSVARATDVLWTLNHPDVWHLLVDERGWSAGAYERWFADAACAQLLRPE